MSSIWTQCYCRRMIRRRSEVKLISYWCQANSIRSSLSDFSLSYRSFCSWAEKWAGKLRKTSSKLFEDFQTSRWGQIDVTCQLHAFVWACFVQIFSRTSSERIPCGLGTLCVRNGELLPHHVLLTRSQSTDFPIKKISFLKVSTK